MLRRVSDKMAVHQTVKSPASVSVAFEKDKQVDCSFVPPCPLVALVFVQNYKQEHQT